MGKKDKEEEERKDESKGLYQRERERGRDGAEEQKNQTTDERRQKIREKNTKYQMYGDVTLQWSHHPFKLLRVGY